MYIFFYILGIENKETYDIPGWTMPDNQTK